MGTHWPYSEALAMRTRATLNPHTSPRRIWAPCSWAAGISISTAQKVGSILVASAYVSFQPRSPSRRMGWARIL